MKYNNTKIVNAFAGPGAGKTTACLEIVSQLKMRGKSAEYVPEYAKELVWDERTQLLDGSLMNQLTILCEQYKRIKRLFHKVDYIVTDSPLWLNLLYYRYSSYKQRNVYMDLLQDIEILKNQYNARYCQGTKLNTQDTLKSISKEIGFFYFDLKSELSRQRLKFKSKDGN